jgi:hypothetical protein
MDGRGNARHHGLVFTIMSRSEMELSLRGARYACDLIEGTELVKVP